MTQGSENRGAALIIAVAIFTILLVVGLTFYSSSRMELQQATNVENSFRTELISNAGLALAVSMIQNDAQLYPHATSIDHPWTTYFNGTWIAGKPWAFASGVPWAPNPFTGFNRNSVPYIVYENVLAMEADITDDINLSLAAGNFARVARLQQVRAPLYVPRYQAFPTLASLEDPATNAFVIEYAFLRSQIDPTYDPSTDGAPTAPQLTPQQQIAFYADVDNDEDGLPDSMWIPVPVEQFFGGVDKDGDGLVSVDEGGDGIDNDLDGTIDEPNETAIYVYWGGNDGRDNNGNGQVDEDPGEQKLFLTAPIVVSSVWGGNDGIDNDNDGLIDEENEQRLFQMVFPERSFDTINVRVDQDILKDFAGIPRTDPDINSIVQNSDVTGDGDVDSIDNDFSMIVSDVKGHAYNYLNLNGDIPTMNDDERAFAARESARSYNVINTDPGVYDNHIAPYQVVTASGEPVCEVAGRVAILITDEASKINLNKAGGLAATTNASGDLQLTWAFNEGVGTEEVDIRSVPNFGVPTGQQVAQLRHGTPQGGPFFNLAANLNGAAYDYDVAMPGYGGVDDNGNTLWMSMNGIDDDGDGLIDELWEGIDEPSEHQLFRPLRNALAETDTIDNDLDDSTDEIGEYGDRLFRTQDQVTLVSNIAAQKAQWLRNTITTQSTDRNQRNQYYTRDADANILQQLLPPTSGLKLDYNYALADNIALALREDWDYPAFTDVLVSIPETRYADGLRREDINLVNAPYGVQEFPGDPIIFEADAELRSYQLALNIMEHRDRDHAGNYAEVRTPDRWWFNDAGDVDDPPTPGLNTGEPRLITYRMRGVESIRITELMVRAVRRVEAEAEVGGSDQFDPNLFSAAEGRTNDFDYEYEFMTDIAGISPANGTIDWTSQGNGNLSDRHVLATDVTEVNDASLNTYPNIIQFRFGPSPQLPPGRYYLMFNSSDEDGDPTVELPSDVDFRVKYARLTDPDIIDDELAAPGAGPFSDPNYEITVGDPQIGLQDAVDPVGTPSAVNPASGWVLLPTSAGDQTDELLIVNPAADVSYAGIPGAGNPKNEAFTVVIPPYSADQYYLYVAIASTKAPGEDFAINFFDLSQEPDHEWVEVTNIAEDPEGVNIGGWQLEVGGDADDRGRRLFEVPVGTMIAPGGSLLLGFNKYDVGSENFDLTTSAYPLLRDFYKNGIGLVRGPSAGDLANISEPPIPRYAAPGETGFGFVTAWGTTLANSAGADSVFFRVEDTDFVDNDGDGLVDGVTPDDLVTSANRVPPLGINPGFPAAGAPATKAWDRIIRLDPILSDELLAVSANETAQLANAARMVLGGGVFPNYPEFDLLDNDQDNAALMTDGIDNDGDGLIDGADIDEGVDEGRYRRETGLVVPGTYDDEPVNFGFATNPQYVWGSGAFLWTDWKDFVERRYFPGDCVIVTLYDGAADAGRIADRVTYTQHDVENRSFDDELRCPYLATEIPNAGLEVGWPANTMGIDFYRSLERRHPLYNGDRVGTQNRWLATDGNYDDWHHGTNRLFPDYSGATPVLESIMDPTVLPAIGAPFNVPNGEIQFGHGISGSPLRSNYFQRLLEEPGTLAIGSTRPQIDNDPGVGSFIWTFDRARVRNRELASLGDLITVPHLTLTKELGQGGFNLLGAESIVGEGPMLGRDFPKDLRAVLETGRLDSIVLSVATADFYPLYPRIAHIGPPGGDQSLVEWSIAKPPGPRGWAPVFLTPLDPAGSEPPGNTITATAASVPALYPQLTVSTSYPIQLNFLQQPIVTYPGTVPANYLQDPLSPAPRWPLEKRAVMYVSVNPDNFDPYSYNHDAPTPVALTTDHPSEALFVWDGDDGVPNGEYDLYVVTLDDVEGLVAPNTDLAANASDFAKAFVPRAQNADPTLTAVDVGVLTDRNGDRRVWEDSGNLLPDTAELGQGVQGGEGYGLKTGLTPASDGSIHYGVVKVENNYLAVFIRNWAPPGHLNRISRVVLTTRDKTAGRINLNTAITRMVQNGGISAVNPTPFGAYNPLASLPGIMGEYLPDGSFNPRFFADDYNPLPGDLDSAGASALDPLALNDPLGRAERAGAVTARGVAGGDGLNVPGDGRGFWNVNRLDGRYYRFQSELVAAGDNLIFGPALQLAPALLAPNLVQGSIWPPENMNELLEVADLQALQFDEMLARYKRIANIVTARSDVFEIIVTAQSGYGFDANGDGFVNWRDPNEFVVNGERKTRTVYER
jgi:hypothetical protein